MTDRRCKCCGASKFDNGALVCRIASRQLAKRMIAQGELTETEVAKVLKSTTVDR